MNFSPASRTSLYSDSPSDGFTSANEVKRDGFLPGLAREELSTYASWQVGNFISSGVGVDVTPSRRCRLCRADHVNSGIPGIGSIEWVSNTPWSYISH